MKKLNQNNEKFPDPKELEKELGDFLTKRFGGSVKLATPVVLPQSEVSDTVERPVPKLEEIDFDLKPEELVAYLDQYIIKQASRQSDPGHQDLHPLQPHPAQARCPIRSDTWSAASRTTS
jgi:hypothetical protein